MIFWSIITEGPQIIPPNPEVILSFLTMLLTVNVESAEV